MQERLAHTNADQFVTVNTLQIYTLAITVQNHKQACLSLRTATQGRGEINVKF